MMEWAERERERERERPGERERERENLIAKHYTTFNCEALYHIQRGGGHTDRDVQRREREIEMFRTGQTVREY